MNEKKIIEQQENQELINEGKKDIFLILKVIFITAMLMLIITLIISILK